MPHDNEPHEIIMPALGMAQDTGLIVSWLKSPGDAVKAGDALFEVETDKATMEVEAPADGFLTDVRAEAGAEVPVGDVIALISETAEDRGTAAPAAAPAGDMAEPQALPEGAEVIMPALGMAQDTGLIVAWHKTPGDAVGKDDILFEVETDKSTMEVEAGHDGFVAALLAEAGEEAPVGDTIAIISTEKPATPVQRSVTAAAAPEPAAPAEADETPQKAVPAAPKPASSASPRADGRILASPKARRLALEEGLDLNRLAEAGHPQPYHVRDLDTLRSLPDTAPATAQAEAAARHLTARATDGFTDFAAWASESAGLTDPAALLAGMAAASLGRDAVVAVEQFGQTRSYAAAAILGDITESEDAPALRLRDMRGSALRGVRMGAEEIPALTLTDCDGGLAITLECGAAQLSPDAALALISSFAGRIEQPLRHLL